MKSSLLHPAMPAVLAGVFAIAVAAPAASANSLSSSDQAVGPAAEPFASENLHVAPAQSARAASGFGHYSPGKAALVGLVATVAPGAVAYAATPDPARSQASRGVNAALGTTLGVMVGPAIGLASGGRGDLARRGLIVRGVCLAAVVGGVYGAANMLTWGESDATSMALLAAGTVGVGVAVISSAYDLAITPSAVSKGKRSRAALMVSPNGTVAVRVSF